MLKRNPKTANAEAPQEYRKPRADVYTVLLVVALLFLIIATVTLWMTMKEYDYQIKGGPLLPAEYRPAIGTALDVTHGVA